MNQTAGKQTLKDYYRTSIDTMLNQMDGEKLNLVYYFMKGVVKGGKAE